MSEHQEQVYFFNWIRRNRAQSQNSVLAEALSLCYAVNNNAQKAQKAKMEGLERGMPDINLDWPVYSNSYLYRMESPGLRIEMKFGGNTLSKYQKEKKSLLEEAGFIYRVCYSAKEAIEAVMDYLPFPETDYIPPKYL